MMSKPQGKALQYATLAALALVLAGGAFLGRRVLTTPRIGVVDNNQLMSQFSEAIRARKTYAEEEKVWKEQAKRIEDSARAAMAAMSSKYEKAGPAERKSLEEGLMKWNQEINRYANATRRAAEKREGELMRPVTEKVDAFVKTWAKRHGFDVLYGTGSGGVILTAEAPYEVTDRLLADLNALYGPENPAPADSARVGVVTDTSAAQQGLTKVR